MITNLIQYTVGDMKVQHFGVEMIFFGGDMVFKEVPANRKVTRGMLLNIGIDLCRTGLLPTIE